MHLSFLSDGGWHLMLPSSAVYDSNTCQRKESFRPGKKGVERWSHGKPLTGRRENGKRLRKQLAPLKFHHADQERVTQNSSQEFWSSVMKITRKTVMPNVSSHGCGNEFLKQSTNSTIPNLFPFWKPPLQDSCQKGPNSATPLSFCSRILCVFIEITCITKRMPRLRRDKMRPLHLQKYKVPGIKEKGTGLAVCTGHIQCPLAGRKDPDALHPGWAPQTGGTRLPLRLLHWLASDPRGGLLWRILPNWAVVLRTSLHSYKIRTSQRGLFPF